MREEFTRAYDSYADAIFRHCYFRVSDKEKAKDLMQETFIRTWDYIEKGNKIQFKKIKSFLYKTASNLIIDEYRKNKGTTSLEGLRDKGFEIGIKPELDRAADVQIEVRRVMEVLDDLGKQYREVVIMRYIDGLAPKEISEITGDTTNNVSVKLNRAVRNIKEIIAADEE